MKTEQLSKMLQRIVLIGAVLQVLNAQFLFPDLPLFAENTGEKQCDEDFESFKGGLNNLSYWAFQMLDSSGRAPSGRLHGNMYAFGNFEECLSINGPLEPKYCLVRITARGIPAPNPPRDPKSLTYGPNESVLRKLYAVDDEAQQKRNAIQIGWCVPSSCKSSTLENYINKNLKLLEHNFKTSNVSYAASINEKTCQINQSAKYSALELIFCVLTAIIVGVVLLATLMDYSRKKSGSIKKSKFADIFSAINSFHDLGSVNYDTGLSSLNGIKCFSFVMVFIGHVLTLTIVVPIKNVNFIEELAKSEPLLLFLNGSLFIDAFFVISAFLLVYKLHDCKKNIGFWIFTRYISLTPTFAYTILFYASMLNRIGHGPLWDAIVGPEVEDCKANWWASLLYVSNYVNANNKCMFQSWYLDCDFHFFLIGILLIYIHNKNERLAKVLIIVLLIASTLICFVYVYQTKIQLLHSLSMGTLARLKSSPEFVVVYETSHTRIGPYFIGMIGGYIYVQMKKKKLTFSTLKSNIIYFTSSIFLLASMFSGAYFYHANYKFDAVINAAYISIYRNIWALGTVGLILCINFGNAFFLKSVLSWKPFIPISKLIYGAYISHMIFLYRNMGIVQVPVNYDLLNMWAMLFGFMVYSFFASLLLYVCIEAPVKNLYRVFFSKRRREVCDSPTISQNKEMLIIHNNT